jgi:hypothetical protein
MASYYPSTSRRSIHLIAEVRDTIFRVGRKNVILLEGSQATPARPSGRIT